MQFKECDWLSGHGIWAIIPCPTNMVSILMNFGGRFYFHFSLQCSFPRFWGVFNSTIIPLALVVYEMIIANLALCASLAIISHPTRVSGIIVKYTTRKHHIQLTRLYVHVSIKFKFKLKKLMYKYTYLGCH